MFAFVGAHRSGKSTLARRISADLGYHFYEASFGRMAKELGFDAVADLTLEERMKMQEAVLARYQAEINDLPRPCITDRTPLDMMAYMMAEVGMHSQLDPEMAARIVRYKDACIDIVARFFGCLVVCRPLPAYVFEVGKPPENVAFQWHIQMLIEAGVDRAQFRGVCIGYLNSFDLEVRALCASQLFESQLKDMQARRLAACCH